MYKRKELGNRVRSVLDPLDFLPAIRKLTDANYTEGKVDAAISELEHYLEEHG